MKFTIPIIAAASMCLATGVSAQTNRTQAAVQEIQSGLNRILNPQESAAGASNAAPGTAEQAIANWKQQPQSEAKTLIAKYGQPNEVTTQRLIWHNNGPWKRTEIINEEIEHDFPTPHKDFLCQTIDFRVPAEKFTDLATFDGSLLADRTAGELSVRCDKEENNFLALNLAQDVVNGSKTAQQARDALAKTEADAKNGTMASTMKGFQFNVAKHGTADPDNAANEAAGSQNNQNQK